MVMMQQLVEIEGGKEDRTNYRKNTFDFSNRK